MMAGADVKFSIEQDGCLAEVVIPVEIMRELGDTRREYMGNTANDLYDRVRFMVRRVEAEREQALTPEQRALLDQFRPRSL